MRIDAALLLAALSSSFSSDAFSQTTPVACTGLCLQQVSCPAGGTTSISGVVYAPNGTDPLPNVTVYVPNAAVDAFTPGVSCPIVGTPPSGSPLVGTTTGVDGSFTITDVPVGTNIPLVIVSGRWRRQITVPMTTQCANTPVVADQTRFPRNKSEGDIPLFAVATGSVDSVECVLRKVGVADSEFTNPSGAGRIQIYQGSGSPGARIDTTTLNQSALMSDPAVLNKYDVLMLPCEGGAYPTAKTAAEYANLLTFANSGGRVYGSHYAYQWMYQNGPFSGVANWTVNQGSYPDGTATVNQGFSGGLTLAQWLQQPAIAASTTQGQIAINTLKHDLNGVIAPTQLWLSLNTTNSPVMQFVFDTPIAAQNQCGRVLFNEYHVESSSVSASQNVAFPQECTTGTMTPQEKLLEYMLFELTDEGGAATLTPTTQDFGTEAIGFNSAPEPFTLTNNSSFAVNAPTITTTGDFTVASQNCASVAAGASCTINVIFNPTVTGARTGTLSVGVGATNLLSTLTGNGIPDLTYTFMPVPFGNIDVGATSAAQSFVVTNPNTSAVPVPGFTVVGSFAEADNCGVSLGANRSCTVTVTFKPTTTGTAAPNTGSIALKSASAAYSNAAVTLTGNGVDFTIVANPGSGTVIAGYNTSFSVVTTPLAGFASGLNLGCTTTAPGSACTVAATSLSGAAAVTTNVAITTISKYTVIGFGGFGQRGWLWTLGLASGCLLLIARRRAGWQVRGGLLLLLLACVSVGMTGCSGQQPAQNSVYTAPGTYSYTITATDGFLVHSATYSLTVTVK